MPPMLKLSMGTENGLARSSTAVLFLWLDDKETYIHLDFAPNLQRLPPTQQMGEGSGERSCHSDQGERMIAASIGQCTLRANDTTEVLHHLPSRQVVWSPSCTGGSVRVLSTQS